MGKKATCLRCSICNLNYKPDKEEHTCFVCDGKLSPFFNTPPHSDLIERIRAAVYKLPDKRIDYGGASALEKFDKEVQSLGGADDFLFECEKGQAA